MKQRADRSEQRPPASLVSMPFSGGEAANPPSTAILLCGDLQTRDNGLDLKELCTWMEWENLETETRVAQGLCNAPDEVYISARAGSRHIVLGLCSSDYAALEMHSNARKVGLDPLGVEVVDLGALCTSLSAEAHRSEKARLLLAAAVARARAYSGSSPANLKSYFPPLSEKMSRRALFTVPPLQYQAVASIASEKCAHEQGCMLCVSACPRGAIRSFQSTVRVDKSKCDPCGICVATCPRGAVELPGNSAAQLSAQIAALIGTETGVLDERNILFACKSVLHAPERGAWSDMVGGSTWLPVEVPCVGMISAGCILECLARGATTVGILTCGDDCPFDQGSTVDGRVEYCKKALRLLGDSPERVTVLAPAGEGSAIDLKSGTFAGGLASNSSALHPDGSFFGPEVAARALLQIAEAHGVSSDLCFEHPHSPFGTVHILSDLCTGCGACAVECPTGALIFRTESGSVSLTFDPMFCTGCGNCESNCPESHANVIQVKKMTDLGRLNRGSEVLFQEKYALCASCGAAIAPQAMINRIEALLSRGSSKVSTASLRYCPECRVVSAFGEGQDGV